LIYGPAHFRYIKPDQLPREPVGWDKLPVSEIQDGIAPYAKIIRDNISSH
jgi:hypothetical protein